MDDKFCFSINSFHDQKSAALSIFITELNSLLQESREFIETTMF